MALIVPTLLAAALIASSGALARSAPESFSGLAKKLLPAVVNISSTQVIERKEGDRPQIPQLPPGSPFEEFFREFFDRQRPDAPPRRATSLGSGFVIDPSGLIVTNNHVIDGADEITINFQDKTSLKAEVIGRDARTDLALLRVEAGKPLPYVKWGKSSDALVGDWVLAIGNPFNLGGTVTAGIISAHHRDINAGPYDDFIQTDASINRGNSGGPLFNLDGEVVGVNTAIFSPSGGSIGIGFAIPSDRSRAVIAQLKEYGKTRRGWLGVRIQTVTDEIAQGLGLKGAAGALVASVTPDGPAEQAKLEAGDVILEFNGKPVEEMRRLPWMVAQTEVGAKVPVVVWRKGKEVTLSVTLGELPEDDKVAAAGGGDTKSSSATVLGLELSSLTGELRERYKIDEDVEGVVITGVQQGSSAAEQRVRPGDVIRKAGQDRQDVRSPADVMALVKEARDAKLKRILLLLERGGEPRFVSLELGDG